MSKNLVFIGDSITAGVTAGFKLDYRECGYAQFIRDYFEKQGELGTYHNFAVSGFMTKDVLNQFKDNITHNENIAFNILREKCYKITMKKVGMDTIEFTHPDVHILDAIKNADMIGLTMGANDLIRLFRRFSDEHVSKVLKSLLLNDYTQETLQSALKNYLVIMSVIVSINPDVEIVLLGTYVPSGEEVLVKRLYSKFALLEDALYDTVAKEFPDNIKLIKPRDVFRDNCKQYISSKLDIHPSVEGHRALANLVLEVQTQIEYDVKI